MQKIELYQRNNFSSPKFALVDDEDYHWLSQFNWYAYSHPTSQTTYVEAKVCGKKIKMHQLLLPKLAIGYTVDHKDHNGLNNQKNNLRPATKSEQQRNRGIQLNNTTGFIGVTKFKRDNNFKAQITINGKTKHLGYFTSKEEAALYYNKIALVTFGEFAVLNVVPAIN